MTAPIVVKRKPSKGEAMMLEILASWKQKGLVHEYRFEEEGIFIEPNRKAFPVADSSVLISTAVTTHRKRQLRGQRICLFNPGSLNNSPYKKLRLILYYFVSQPVPLYSIEVAARLGTFISFMGELNKWKADGRIEGVSYRGGWKVKVTIQGTKYPVPVPTNVKSVGSYLTRILGPLHNSDHSPAEILVYKALAEMKKEKYVKSYLIHPRNAVMDGKGIDITIIPNRKFFPNGDSEVQLQVKRTSESVHVKQFLQRHLGEKIALIKVAKFMQVAHVKMMLRYILERPVEKINGQKRGIELFMRQLIKHREVALKRGCGFDYAGNGEWVFIDTKPKTLAEVTTV